MTTKRRALVATLGLALSACNGGVYADEPGESAGRSTTTASGSSGDTGSGGATSTSASTTATGSGGAVDPCDAAPWALRFGSALDQAGLHITSSADCDIYFSVETTGPIDLGAGSLQGKFYQGAALAALGAQGATRWSRWLESTNMPVGVDALAVDAGGDLWMAGTFQGTLDLGIGPMTAGDHGDLFVARVTREGDVVWARQFTSTQGFDSYGGLTLALDPAGGAVLAGSFSGVTDFGDGPLTALGLDIFLARLDEGGATLWSERFGGPGNTLDEVVSLAIGPDGEILVAGTYEGKLDLGNGPLPSSNGRGFAAALDAGGNVVWSRALDASCAFGWCPLRVAYDASGHAAVAGVMPYDPASPNTDQGVFVQVFEDGDPWFGYELPGRHVSGLRAVDGGFIIAGDLDVGVVARVSAEGAIEWSEGVLSPDDQSTNRGAHGLHVDAGGHVVVIGSFAGTIAFGNGTTLTSAGGEDAFVARF